MPWAKHRAKRRSHVSFSRLKAPAVRASAKVNNLQECTRNAIQVHQLGSSFFNGKRQNKTCKNCTGQASLTHNPSSNQPSRQIPQRNQKHSKNHLCLFLSQKLRKISNTLYMHIVLQIIAHHCPFKFTNMKIKNTSGSGKLPSQNSLHPNPTNFRKSSTMNAPTWGQRQSRDNLDIH